MATFIDARSSNPVLIQIKKAILNKGKSNERVIELFNDDILYLHCPEHKIEILAGYKKDDVKISASAPEQTLDLIVTQTGGYNNIILLNPDHKLTKVTPVWE